MTDLFDKIQDICNKFLLLLLVAVVILAVIYLLYFFVKFHNKSLVKSLRLESSLKIEKRKEDDKVADHINRCISRSTVESINHGKIILLHIPTKRIYEATTQIDIKKQIRKILESEDFREVLSDQFSNYRFEAKPKYHCNEFMIKGTKF